MSAPFKLGHFIGQLHLDEDQKTAVFTVQHYPSDKMHFAYVTSESILIEPADGQSTDFASIPRLLRFIFTPRGSKRWPYGWAAVIHDELYRKQQINGKAITRKYADQVFREAMLVSGVPMWLAKTFYRTLRLTGKRAWNKNKKKLEVNK